MLSKKRNRSRQTCGIEYGKKQESKDLYKNKLQILFFSLILFGSGVLLFCINDQNNPIIPPQVKTGPVEDTTRVYLHPNSGDTLEIYPKALYVKYYPWVEDTAKIMELIAEHNLRLYCPFYKAENRWVSILCVDDNRRAEYHFTPYGQDGFNNLGTSEMVEYAFGIFSRGHYFPSGQIIFKFNEGTSQSSIDSLFEKAGLRLLWISPDYPSGYRHRTTITPEASKNIIDLGWELQSVSFAEYAIVSFYTGGEGVKCDLAKKGVCHEKEPVISDDSWTVY